MLRLAAGRKAEPSATIIDSRTLRSTLESGERSGYDGGKRKKGSKIHMAVDTLGYPSLARAGPATSSARALLDQLVRTPSDILRVGNHPDYGMAVPNPDHFIPLLYLAELPGVEGVEVDPLLRGYAMGSISMTCYGLRADLTLSPSMQPICRAASRPIKPTCESAHQSTASSRSP